MKFPSDVPTLTDGTVTLRAHRIEDAEAVYEQCQDPLSQEWTTVPVPYDRDDAKRFVREIVPGGWHDDTEWSFAVEACDDDGVPRFGGTVSLRNEQEGRAEVAFGSHPWVRGRGVMARALELLLAWGFEERGLRTVIWWANRGNWASRKLAWRLGFSFDGELRQWLPQRGELRDGWVGVLLAGDERVPRGPWYDVPRIVGDRVVLRAHRPDDVPRIVEAGADARAHHWLSLPSPYTEETARAFLASGLERRATGKEIRWVVADPGSDELLANITLTRIKPGEDAEIGYWTHPDARGRGVMTEATRLVVRHAFIPVEDGGMGLHRVGIEAAEGNAASRHVIAANGFTETGRKRRDHRLGDGSLTDTITYDLLVSEWAG
ncbi:MAG TPA: GNAT family protein [Nocardioidaceae bacterium]|nr:GNAT family protein [Nocardioidaceae bacterium]